MIAPRAAETMSRKGWGGHLLNSDSIRKIETMS
jgi:hypothetical protein